MRTVTDLSVIPDTMTVKLSKELHPEQSVQHPEEHEEEGDIVDLLAGPLEDLVEPRLGPDM